jgi:hypothetical protein
MQKLVKNLTGFSFIRLSYVLAFKIPLVHESGPAYGVSNFIPPSFLLTMTHAPF